MSTASRSQAAKRFLWRLAAAATVYFLSIFLTFHVFYHGRLPLPAALGLAAVPSIPLVAIILIVALYLREEKDEFQRELFIQALLWGAGGTLALTSFWSFTHIFAHFPGPDGFHIFIFFWLVVALALYPLRRHYGGSDE